MNKGEKKEGMEGKKERKRERGNLGRTEGKKKRKRKKGI